MRPQDLIQVIACLLARGDGTAFIHDSEAYELKGLDQVVFIREEARGGTRLMLKRDDAPMDLGEAKMVEPRQLPAPK